MKSHHSISSRRLSEWVSVRWNKCEMLLLLSLEACICGGRLSWWRLQLQGESVSDRGRHLAKCTVTLQVRSLTQDKNIHRIIWSCFFFFLLLSNKLNYSNIHGISYWASSMMDLMSGDWIQCITADTQNFQFNQANFALCWQKGPWSKPIIRLRAILVKQRSLWVTLTSSHVHMRLG